MNYVESDTCGRYTVGSNGPTHANGHSGPGPRLMGTDTLNGNDVFNEKGEDLGDIKEFMLDLKIGRVCSVALSYGGFLGMGDKLFAMPFTALKLDTVNKRFVLDVDQDRLHDAPGFDKDHWPNMSDQAWAQGIHTYYGTKPFANDLLI
ncbi:MAG: PRC-barrel domain-containing protein [Casimicrobium sp.]